MCTPTVFLSHASNDRPLVDAVCDLLRDGISQLNLQEVFCTSLDGQGIAPGRDSTSDIKRALLDSAIVIFLISPAFKQSAFCANEVGAAWAINKEILPIAVGPLTYRDLPPVIAGAHCGRLDSETDLNDLRDRVAKQLGHSPVTGGTWDRKRREFIERTKHFSLLNTARVFDFPREVAERAPQVRISMSGLISIRLDGKSLLIRGSRIKDQYQPVGGVMKYYDGAREQLTQLSISCDDLFPHDSDNRYDLRLYLPSNNVDAFVSWLAKKTGREICPWREFYEELLESGIVDPRWFPHAKLEYLKTVYTGIRFSQRVNGYELLIAELFHFDPTPQQARCLCDLMAVSDDRFVWVDDRDILRGVTSSGVRIAEPARWFL